MTEDQQQTEQQKESDQLRQRRANFEELGRLGVYEAVHPESEAGLELGRQALSHLGVPAGDIQRFADKVRRARNRIVSASNAAPRLSIGASRKCGPTALAPSAIGSAETATTATAT